jgi:two-component system sensor histidine kinase QseC
MVRLDLTALARQVVAETAAPAITKRQVLEFDGPAPCHVQGNEALLSILIRNLVDNAVRYSPTAASIQISVHSAQGQVTLTVQDSGPGLSDADLARLGERFFRVTGNTEPGSGLGWSIVQRIAAVHRVAVTVERSAALGGLSVSLNLLPF